MTRTFGAAAVGASRGASCRGASTTGAGAGGLAGGADGAGSAGRTAAGLAAAGSGARASTGAGGFCAGGRPAGRRLGSRRLAPEPLATALDLAPRPGRWQRHMGLVPEGIQACDVDGSDGDRADPDRSRPHVPWRHRPPGGEGTPAEHVAVPVHGEADRPPVPIDAVHHIAVARPTWTSDGAKTLGIEHPRRGPRRHRGVPGGVVDRLAEPLRGGGKSDERGRERGGGARPAARVDLNRHGNSFPSTRERCAVFVRVGLRRRRGQAEARS
jgi:hypothetical protein